MQASPKKQITKINKPAQLFSLFERIGFSEKAFAQLSNKTQMFLVEKYLFNGFRKTTSEMAT